MKGKSKMIKVFFKWSSKIFLLIGSWIILLALKHDHKTPPHPAPINPLKPQKKSSMPHTPFLEHNFLDPFTEEEKKILIPEFKFPNNDIGELIEAIGKATGINFMLDEKVRGKVQMIINSPITLGHAWQLFTSALDINELTLEAVYEAGKQKPKTFKVTSKQAAQSRPLDLYSKDTLRKNKLDQDTLVTGVFTFKHIPVTDKLIKDLNQFSARARIIPQGNTLFIKDTGRNLTFLTQIIEYLDRADQAGKFEIMHIKKSKKRASELHKQIQGLLKNMLLPSSSRFSSSSQTGPYALPGGGIIYTIIVDESVDESTNALIVCANDTGLNRMRQLIRLLDHKEENLSQSAGNLHVVKIKYGDAKKLNETLSKLFQAYASSNTKGGIKNTPLFEGSIITEVDEPTNSLIIIASPSDFNFVNQLIQSLDVRQNQVHLEMAIIESNQNHGNENLFKLLPNESLKALAQTQDFGAGGGGLNFPLSIAPSIIKADISAILKAVQSDSNSDLLGNPSVFTNENHKVQIRIDQNIPVKSTRHSPQGDIDTFTQQLIPIDIEITPRICAQSLHNPVEVNLEIKFNWGNIDSTIVPKNLQQEAVGSTNRILNVNQVTVKPKETAYLGGMIRTENHQKEKKVPFFGDIPIIGRLLFKHKDYEIKKLALLFFIYPTIIQTQDQNKLLLDQVLEKWLHHQDEGNTPNLIDIQQIKNFHKKGVTSSK